MQPKVNAKPLLEKRVARKRDFVIPIFLLVGIAVCLGFGIYFFNKENYTAATILFALIGILITATVALIIAAFINKKK